ncbi:MAG: ribonuclease H family protein [Bacteroidaceae bacterium]|nr:ribonuclease H family protein [Bacteroidaceae bacterium]
MAKKPKYYVVWEGHTPGIYTEWEEAEAQVKGYPEAAFKAFSSREEAEIAYEEGPMDYIGNGAKENGDGRKDDDGVLQKCKVVKDLNTPKDPKDLSDSKYRLEVLRKQAALKACQSLPATVDAQAIAVDAACSGNPGQMEYRGVYLRTGEEIFHYGPVFGTNNIGEFLAIVHGLALLQQRGYTIPIYSDSVNAMLWVKRKQCRTTLPLNDKTQALHEHIRRAETWLRTHTYTNDLRKWETEKWGEIPADFGRKG